MYIDDEDDEDNYNNPNFHSKEQDELEIPDGKFRDFKKYFKIFLNFNY
jgi:hypothetical protein